MIFQESSRETSSREAFSLDAASREVVREDAHRTHLWPWRIALVLETPEVVAEVSDAVREFRGECSFRIAASAPAFEVAGLVERERPDVLLAELARVPGNPAEWITTVRAGADVPLIVAVHLTPDPATMIEAMRAGAGEFLSLPVRPAVFEALDRVATMLESRKAAATGRGRMAGVLSAKGGCGATSIACHLAAALRPAGGSGRVLVADLDTQSAAAHRVLRAVPKRRVGEAFDNVRRMNTACWSDFSAPAADNLDLLAGWDAAEGAPALPESWRIESLFRFLTRNYLWTIADLGRHLNPSIWTFLQNVDELFIVTAPDVLALYQTRSILQTLSGRGFDKSRLRLILNRNQAGPQDFWIESIEKMFEMGVAGVIPEDTATIDRLSRERFEFPSGSPFGRAITKLAARVAKPLGGPESGGDKRPDKRSDNAKRAE
jgi:pilus assembly protein CpaE